MKRVRDKHSNRTIGVFTYEDKEYEVVQRGGHPSKDGWVGEPPYLVVDTIIDNINCQVMAVKGDLTLEGDEVVRRWEDVMANGKSSPYFVDKKELYK